MRGQTTFIQHGAKVANGRCAAGMSLEMRTSAIAGPPTAPSPPQICQCLELERLRRIFAANLAARILSFHHPLERPKTTRVTRGVLESDARRASIG